MRPRSVKELVGYVIDVLENGGVVGVHAVFSGVPHALVVEESDVYKVMLWKDCVKLRITLKKDTLEPVAMTLEA